MAEIPRARAERGIVVLGGAGLVVAALLILGLAWFRVWFLRADGFAAPADILAFWTASGLALGGEALSVYDATRMQAVQAGAMGIAPGGHFPWLYPPTYLLFVLPLGLLAYPLAWAAWVAATGTAYLLALRPVLGRLVVPVALGAPAAFWCIVFGQNGFLTAALMAGALVLLDRRPLAAGVLVGLLTIKPQFGLLLALVLLGTGRWPAVAGAVLGAAGLALAATLAFGWDLWPAFLAVSAGGTGGLLMSGVAGWSKLQTVFALAQGLLGDRVLALAVHGVVGLGVAWLVLRLWRQPARPGLRNAALVAGSVLVSPYAYVYDAPILVAAAAFLLRDMLDHGMRRGEAALLGLALLLPAGLVWLGSLPGPLAGAIILALAWRRAG